MFVLVPPCPILPSLMFKKMAVTLKNEEITFLIFLSFDGSQTCYIQGKQFGGSLED